MTDRWSERIASHAAIALLREFSDLLAQGTEASPDTSAEAAAYLHRAQVAISSLSARLTAVDAVLVPVLALDNAVPHLQAAQSEVQGFLADKDEGHLRNLDTHIDRALVEMRSLPPLSFPGEAEVATRAADDYAQHLLRLEEDLRTAFVGLREQILAQSVQFAESAAASESRVDSAAEVAEERLVALQATADQRVTEITAESQARIAELRAEIDSQKGRLDEAITQHQKAFFMDQERRLKESKDSEDRRGAAFVERVDKLIAQTSITLDGFVAEAGPLVQELKEHEAHAAQIVGVAAASRVAGGYLDEAEQQRREANRWRLFGLGVGAAFMVYAIMIAAWARPDIGMSASEWLRYAVVRAPVGLVLAGFLPWVLGQSKEHRRREQAARRLGLELSAFRPFLSELSEDERNKRIIEASTRYFPGHYSQSTPAER